MNPHLKVQQTEDLSLYASQDIDHTIKLLEEQKRAITEGLPHLHSFKWYEWAYTFFQSRNRMNFLCAANQISKSSTQIRKAIHWATEDQLWPELWPETYQAGGKPNLFWYFYPSAPVATTEFKTKWMQFLPRGSYKTHPKYGWKEFYKKGEIDRIEFNSGITLEFKFYTQDPMRLQASSVFALFCDEELPEGHYPELRQRINAVSGYFHMVFTATLGQEFWRLTMEPDEKETPKFPNALKIQVSLFDCQEYRDGTKTHWTDAKIQQTIEECGDEDEVLRRVYGRFVLSKGRIVPFFKVKYHMIEPHYVPKSWLIYSGADIGGGGPDKQAHKSAVVFVAVAPDFSQGRVFLGWRSGREYTTAGDVLSKHEELRGHLSVIEARYDWACADYKTLAARMNISVIPAEKGHETGERIMNDLFKYNMLKIYKIPDLMPLSSELVSLRKGVAKRSMKDDFYDALRYCIATIPWNFTVAKTGIPDVSFDGTIDISRKMSPEERELAERREFYSNARQEDPALAFEDEFQEANDAYEGC